MDNELQDLEAELKRLRPVRPSPAIAAKIERELGTPRRTLWMWMALPLAAAFVAMLSLKEKTVVAPESPAPAPAKSVATYKPVSAENVLYDHRDEGLVTMADGTTARRFRSSYVDTITWKNPRTQASLKWSVPRTDVRVVPVSFQ